MPIPKRFHIRSATEEWFGGDWGRGTIPLSGDFVSFAAGLKFPSVIGLIMVFEREQLSGKIDFEPL